MRAIRERVAEFDKSKAAHAGLILDRYLAYAKDTSDAALDARRDVFEAARAALRSAEPLYRRAFDRRAAAPPAHSREVTFETAPSSRLIVGLGGHHVLETGLTLHHTYGTPVIPGTALKGLAAHYCDQVWGVAVGNAFRPAAADSPEYEGNAFRVLFGTQDEGGLVTFHDAWIRPEGVATCLTDDVMTPHHGDYYMASGAEVPAPGDFDSPVPVTFLSVVGKFSVVVSADPQLVPAQVWLDLTVELLTQALREPGWGVGGKTPSGYGRLTRSE